MLLAATGLPAAPPLDFPVAEDALNVAFAAAAVVLALSVVWAVRNWRVTGSPLHLLCLAGGLISSLDEAIVDILGKCWFPNKGIAYTAYGRQVPWWVVFCYVIFFGNLPYLFVRGFQKGIKKRFFWQCIAAGFAFNALIEMPVLSVDVYTYYGHQPFNLGGFPLWWMFVNTGGALSAGFLIWRFGLPLVQRRPALLAAVPLVTAPTYLAWSVIVGLPLHTTLNTGASLALTTVAGAVTIALCLGAYHLMTEVACSDGAWRHDAERQATGASSTSEATFSASAVRA